MNYDEIKTFALEYADREDAQTINNMDNFLRIVESRINKSIKVGGLTIRTSIVTLSTQEYYGLPEDYSALRDIEIQTPPVLPATLSTERQTLEFLSPKQMNDFINNTNVTVNTPTRYTVIAGNQIQIYPPQDNKILEIVYYQKLTPLDNINSSNWVSSQWPEVYIYGLMVEISAFVKDAGTAQLWEQRFIESLNSVTEEDKESRWSGTVLKMRVE